MARSGRRRFIAIGGVARFKRAEALAHSAARSFAWSTPMQRRSAKALRRADAKGIVNDPHPDHQLREAINATQQVIPRHMIFQIERVAYSWRLDFPSWPTQSLELVVARI
jgi:hypothetical protein